MYSERITVLAHKKVDFDTCVAFWPVFASWMSHENDPL